MKRLACLFLLAAGFADAQEVRQDRSIILSAPNVQCPNCKKAIETALKAVRGVTEATVDVGAKTVEVKYDHHLTSAARLATHVVAVKPLHGKPYESSLILSVEGLTKENADKVVADLKTFKNPYEVEPVVNAIADVEKKRLIIAFKPVKLDDARDRGTDVNPLLNAAKKVVAATGKPAAPAK